MSEQLVSLLLGEIESGAGLSLAAAGQMFPAHRGTGKVDHSTVFRWVRDGMRTVDGRRVKLEAVRVGTRWITSRPAVERFVTALTVAASAPPVARPNIVSNAIRQRAAESAAQRLIAAGA